MSSSVHHYMTENEEELESLRLQLQTLKELYQASQKPSLHDDNQIFHQRRLRELSLENERHKHHIETLSQIVTEREKKILELQRAGKALSEKLKDLHHSFEQSQEALKQEISQNQESCEEIDALHAQFVPLKTTCIALQQQVQGHEKERQLWQDDRRQLDLVKAALTQANEVIDELQKKSTEADINVRTLADEKQQALAECLQAKNAQEDAEARLKFAHFHLAKKVKETTELSDKVQAQEMQLRHYEAGLIEADKKVCEQQALLSGRLETEKRVQEQWQDSLDSAEAMVASWETKYSKLFVKWQENEERLTQCIRLVERHKRAQNLVSKLNHLFDDDDNKLEFSNIPPSFDEEGVETESLEGPTDQAQKAYQNLFDMPQKKFKNSLFE